MKKILSKIIFFLMGWKLIGPNKYPKKCIVIAAPHTSNWDFFVGMCYGYILGAEFRYLIKAEFFIPVLGALFRYNGGIPVYRDSNYNLVEQLTNMFNKSEDLILVITPEGTRSRVEKWKTGFYHIAHNSNIPVLLLAMDFEKKQIGIINEITEFSDIEKDLFFIQKQFKNIKGKKPENYNPIIR